MPARPEGSTAAAPLSPHPYGLYSDQLSDGRAAQRTEKPWNGLYQPQQSGSTEPIVLAQAAPPPTGGGDDQPNETETPGPSDQQPPPETEERSIGQRLLQNTADLVPGRYYGRLAAEQLRAGNYGNAALYEGAAFLDAILAAATLGAGSSIGNPARTSTAPLVGSAESTAVGIGKYAGESIPTRSSARTFTPAERAEINRIGSKTGCHTCGTIVPGTKTGNFVLDHQPPSALKRFWETQRLYPQCVACSNRQGQEIAKRLRGP